MQIYALLLSLSPCLILTLTHPLIHSFFAPLSLHTHSLTIFLIASFLPSLSRFLPHSFPRFSLHSLLHRIFIALLIAYLSLPSRFFLAPSLGRSHPLSFILSSFPSSPYLQSEFFPLISSFPFSLAQAFALLFLLSVYFRLWKVPCLMLAVESENKQRLYEQVLIFLFSETLE